ncbi:conserved hypothetical protein [Rubrivivax sp. A210]|uniref:hypothetical protein n=1 Tax=Rubrivivax sp. A210 TaxID=2772301 RepID=UPI0019187E54|nr:hypothetical protein [Rubrivivax sp. A210]CAD5366054.1 conserved hypothetical protein [Rubrivivax sp. A210]
MGLTATLSTKLDCRSLGTTLLAELSGPVADLAGVALPASDEALQGLGSGASGIDLSSLDGVVGNLAQLAQPLLAALPDPAAIFGPLGDAVALVETATQHDLSVQVNGLLDQLRAELEAPTEGGRPALPTLLLRLVQILSGSAEGQVLKGLVEPLLGAAGVRLPALGGVSDALAAATGTLSITGALMSLETVLAEAQGLAATMARTIDPVGLRSAIEGLNHSLSGGPVSLADFVTGLAADDSAGLAAARIAVADIAGQLTLLPERLGAEMGMAEATLVYLDVDKLAAEVDAARAALRAAEADTLGRFASQLAALLAPLFSKLDPSMLPAGQLDTLAARAEAEIAGIAASITAIDPATFVAPLSDGIATLTAPLRELDRLIAEVMTALRSALDTLRQAVAALPFQAVADALRSALEPVSALLDAVTALLDDIEAALQTAADVTGGALGEVDAALARFKTAIDGLFGEVKDAVDAIDLQAAVGQIGQGIQDFSQVLSQARLKPYFDTAVDAIGSATDVVAAVPFDMLPDSMKPDVDAVVAPIKSVDVGAVQTQIEGLLGISADGRFTPRDDLTAAIAELQAKYQTLLDLVEANHPRELLAEVDQRLDAIAERVQALEPGLTLQPVREALDSVKAVLQGIDLTATLEPVQQVFDDIVAALDRYAPSALVAPLQERISAVRTQLLAQIGYERWQPTLDELSDSVVGLLDMADPARLQAPLRSAFDEALALLAQFPSLDPGRSLGSLVALLAGSSGLRVSPNSFGAVRGWLFGEADAATALSARSAALAVAFEKTRAAVAAVDVDSTAPGAAAAVAALRGAVQALAGRLAAGNERAAFEALLPRLDASLAFAGLQANRARLLTGLERAVGLATQFSRSGYSEADAAAQRLRQALAPLAPAAAQLQLLMAAAGIPKGQLSVVGVVQAVLAAVPPERMAALPMPLFEALRGRLRALLDAVIAPLRDALASLQSLLDAIDLTPLAEAADGVVAEVKTQVLALSPAQLLAGPIASFDTLRAAFVDSDPLSRVLAIIENLRDLVASVLEKLSLEVLLATPLEIYDDLLAQLRAVDPTGLLDPVFDELDAIAAEVSSGLDDTVAGFKRLQDALPAASA